MKILPFQKRGVRQIEKWNGRALLADEYGLGKTVQSLLFPYRNKKKALPTIVVCQASTKYQWHREASRLGMLAVVLQGERPQRSRRLTTPAVAIVNYDILEPWLPYLLSLEAKTIIIDECQEISNPDTLRYRCTKELARKADHVIAISATPLLNRPIEIWPALNLTRPELYPSRWQFGMDFCSPEVTPWRGIEFRGASNLDKLHELLKSNVMIRRLKADVLHELPQKTRHIVPLEINNRDEYYRAQFDFVSWLRETKGKGITRRAMKAQRMVQMSYLRMLAAELKLPYAIEWLDNWFSQNPNEKLIIFAIHKEIVSKLHEKYKGRSVVVDGGVRGKKRQLAVDTFQLNKRCKAIICNIKAGGVGLNLTAAAHTAVLEFPWQPGLMAQAENRNYARLSDVHGADVYYLTGRKTIDARMASIICKKQRILSSVLDGGRGDDFDIFDELEKGILKDVKAYRRSKER